MNIQKLNQRILWIDQLRAIAMFFVVLGHVALPKQMNTYIYAFHMPMFFIISGMTHRPGKYKTFTECLIDKGKKLLLPYYFMNLAMLPVWLLNFKILTVAKPNLIELFKGLFFINSGQYQTPSNATWFLAALFIIEVLIYFFEKITYNRVEQQLMWAVICAIISYVESINKVQYALPWHIDSAFSGVLFYFIGYLWMKNHEQVMEKIDRKKGCYFIIIILLTSIGFYFSNLNGRISMNGNVQRSFFYYYATALAFSFSIILIVIKMPVSKYLTYIGQNTIIYLGFHIPMIRLIENSLKITGYKSDGWWAFFIAVFVFILMSMVVKYVNFFVPFVIMKPYKKSSKSKIVYSISIITILIYLVILITLIVKAISWGRLKLF